MTRLLSPTKKRIYPNPSTGLNQGDSERSTNVVRRASMLNEPGEPDLMTVEALKKAGWTDYDGPGKTDKLGFVIPGTL